RRVLDDPKVPDANRLSEPALLDHIPALVRRLIESLENGTSGEALGRAIGGDGAAKAHALDRLQRSYSLAEALRELSHLRAVVIDLSGEAGRAFEVRDTQLVHAAIDEAMTTVAVEIDEAA